MKMINERLFIILMSIFVCGIPGSICFFCGDYIQSALLFALATIYSVTTLVIEEVCEWFSTHNDRNTDKRKYK
jgi:hypothetical protein